MHVVFSCRWMNSYRKKRRSPNNTMWWNIKWDPFPMNTTISWSSRALLLFRNISNLVFYVKKCYEYVGLCHFLFPPYLNKEIWRFSVSPHKTFTFLPLNYFHLFTPHCEIQQLEESPQKIKWFQNLHNFLWLVVNDWHYITQKVRKITQKCKGHTVNNWGCALFSEQITQPGKMFRE